MEFVQTQSGDVVIVKLVGRFDGGNAHTVEQSVAGVLDRGASRLVIDLSNLEYVSSAGLRVLLIVANRIQRTDGKLAVFGLNGGIRAVFSISRFDKIFPIEADLAAAVAAVS
jgi:anti-anti-sigma factor